MAAQHIERRTAAIFAADVVGYSRLMNEREEATLYNLNACLKIFRDAISAHGGRVFGGAGDSIVAEFPSTVEAVRCAVEVQKALAHRNAELSEDDMQFRIGINVGDVIVEGDNLMGDGVNVTSRLEGLAEPGGICISDYVYHQVRNKVEAGFQNLGRKALKNIPESVQVYKVIVGAAVTNGKTLPNMPAASYRRIFMVAGGAAASIAIAGILFVSQSGLTIPFLESTEKNIVASERAGKPSIVVLPFINRSDDPEQDYFVDGITEDIITSLSQISSLTVIAWNTSSSFKGKTVQPRQVGKDVGVRYLLEGSVRKSGNQLRITAQLVDTVDGTHIWADRYDRNLLDVFALQDEVAQKIVAVLAIKLTPAEKGQLAHSGTNNLAAYDAFLRGLQYYRQRSKEGDALARDAYRKAIALDSGYARPYGALAITLTFDAILGWSELTTEETRERALELAQKAVALDKSSPEAHWALGFVYLFRKQYDEAEAAAKQAVALAPNYADGYGLLAFVNNWQGNAEDAVRHIRKAMVLNPYYTHEYPWNLGLAYFLLGRYPEAVEALQDAVKHNESAVLARMFLAVSYVRLGRLNDAQWEIEQVKIQSPDTRLSQLAATLPLKNRDQMMSFAADLRKAGMPDK